MALPRPSPSVRLHLVVVLLFAAVAATAWDHERRAGRPTARSDRAARLALPLSVAPARHGWLALLGRVYREILDDRVLAVAAGVTFYALLALVPSLAALVSLYGLAADPATIADHMRQLYFFLPAAAADLIAGQLARIAARPTETLGATLAFSLALSLWSANAGMKAIFDALNVVHGVDEDRSLVRLTCQTLGFTLGAIALLLLALAGVVAVPVAVRWLGLTALTDMLTVLRWPALAAALAGGLAILYRWGPCRPRPPSGSRWPAIAIASLVAVAAWMAVSMLFSWYVARFADYDGTYGSLGAVVGFMTWMWLSAVVILVGGEIDAEIERQLPWH